MAKSVPTGDSVKSAGMSGAINGGSLAIGELLGRAVLGPGIGTAAGGVLAASTDSGETRDTMALVAVERGMNELVGVQ